VTAAVHCEPCLELVFGDFGGVGVFVGGEVVVDAVELGGERLQLGGLGKWWVGGVVQFVGSGAVVVELTGCGVELVWGSGDDVLNAGHDAARQGCATGLGLVLSRLGVVGEAVGFPLVERATGGPWGPELVLVDEGRGDGEVSVPED